MRKILIALLAFTLIFFVFAEESNQSNKNIKTIKIGEQVCLGYDNQNGGYFRDVVITAISKRYTGGFEVKFWELQDMMPGSELSAYLRFIIGNAKYRVLEEKSSENCLVVQKYDVWPNDYKEEVIESVDNDKTEAGCLTNKFINPAHVVKAESCLDGEEVYVIVYFDNGSTERYLKFKNIDEANDFCAKACGGSPIFISEEY